MIEKKLERSGPEIICPLCDYEFTDSWEFNDSKFRQEIQCGECSEYFVLVGVDFDVTYYTEAPTPPAMKDRR